MRLGSTIARLKLKGIDGDLHKRWIMRLNSMANEEPHQGLHPDDRSRKLELPQGGWAGDAWSSSVRGLSCSLQWGNERNPRCLFYMSGETALSRGRKVRMTPDQHVPLISWAARMIQWARQRDAMGQPGANLLNAPPVRIEVCNSTS